MPDLGGRVVRLVRLLATGLLSSVFFKFKNCLFTFFKQKKFNLQTFEMIAN